MIDRFVNLKISGTFLSGGCSKAQMDPGLNPMFPKSMKTKLLVGVAALVIASGLTISLWVTHGYGDSLIKAGIAQAESMARTRLPWSPLNES